MTDNFAEASQGAEAAMQRWFETRNAWFDAKNNLNYAIMEREKRKKQVYGEQVMAEYPPRTGNDALREARLEQLLGEDESFLHAHASVAEHEADVFRLELETEMAHFRRRQAERHQKYVIAKIGEATHG